MTRSLASRQHVVGTLPRARWKVETPDLKLKNSGFPEKRNALLDDHNNAVLYGPTIYITTRESYNDSII